MNGIITKEKTIIVEHETTEEKYSYEDIFIIVRKRKEQTEDYIICPQPFTKEQLGKFIKLVKYLFDIGT